MHYNADDMFEHAAALSADAIEGQQGGRENMQPLGSAADAKARFVQVLDLRLGHALVHCFGDTPQPTALPESAQAEAARSA